MAGETIAIMLRVAMIVLLPGCELVFDLPDPVPCPDAYTLTINSLTSRYQVIDEENDYNASELICAESERTHLATPDTITELAGLEMAVAGNMNQNRFWIGVKQDTQAPNVFDPGLGWRLVTGAELLPGEPVSGVWKNTEPNDEDTIESNQENVAFLESNDDSGYLRDNSASSRRGAICECDVE